MQLANLDDPNVYLFLGAIAVFFAVVFALRMYWAVSGHMIWATRVRELLAGEGFRVRHMERRWLTRGPFADMRTPGTKGHREWLVRLVADDATNQPRAGWLRWRRRFPWEAADRWAVRWDDVPWSGQWDGAPDPQRKGLPTRAFMLMLVGAAVVALLLTLLAYRASAADDVLTRSRAAYAALKSYSDTGTVGATAFVISSQPTTGSSVLITPLLFPGAGLIGTLEELRDTTIEGTEMIGDGTCHRIAGIASSRYSSGNETRVRRTVVWIDVETLLVRRVFEDTPRGTLAGTVWRVTTTLEPKANPVLDEARFRFTPPVAQR